MRLLYVCEAILVVVALTCAVSVGGGTSDDDGAKSEGAANNDTVNNGYVPGPNCKKLHKLYIEDHWPKRYLRVYSEYRSVIVQWGAHAPSRAAAAVLVAALRHRHNYHRVELRRGKRTLCELAESLLHFNDGNKSFQELMVHVGAEWDNESDCAILRNCTVFTDECGAAGPRLQVVSSAVAPVSLQLYACLSGGARRKSECTRPLDVNPSVLENCDFLQDKTMKKECSSTRCAPVLIPTDAPHALRESLEKRFKTANLPLYLETIEDAGLRARLLNHQDSTKPSFLFLDYNIWAGFSDNSTGIVTVNPPPCSQAPCTPIHDSTSVVTVADTRVIHQLAPLMFDVIRNFRVQPSELRLILNLETNNLTSEEAACSWAYDNPDKFKSLSKGTEPLHLAGVVLCEGDPDIPKYGKVASSVGAAIYNDTNKLFTITILPYYINCSNDNELSQQLHDITKNSNWQRMVGVVGPGASGAIAAAETALNYETQLIFYDVPASAARLNNATYTVTGRLEPLVNATRQFFSTQGWKRIAIISDQNTFATDFSNLLRKEDNDFAYLERHLENETDNAAESELQSLKDVGARVIFINTGAAAAATILCAANKLGMTSAADYAWVAREWRYETPKCDAQNMRHFTVSYSWRGRVNSTVLANTTRNAWLRSSLEKEMGVDGDAWPPHAASLADALWLLAQGLKAGLKSDPSLLDDLHGQGSAWRISEQMSRMDAAAGVVQELRLREHAMEQPLVFLYEWRGANYNLLEVWRVHNATWIVPVTTLQKAYSKGSPPSDGTSPCVTTTAGDKFDPNCHDPAWFGGMAVVMLSLLALCAARRARLTRLVERDRAVHLRLMARCERTADVLRKFLVDRSALELRDEIGAGHFGQVRLGLLRLPNKKPLFVAVKALRKEAAPADEAAFLREASTLSKLAHAHVVQLVGVCVAEDGAPQLLMGHAFFGDLLRYLRERRHLAELEMMGSEMCKYVEAEASHVSPAQLTRLAREAASALDYLARERLVHRDVRAANCLVDAHRTLKLADFGMARATGSNAADGVGVGVSQDCDYEYVCQRRGVFPVPWMAPESVRHGVFSSASDAWSLGVLLLELVSLGARPYGPCRAHTVLRYVLDGRRPPLPHDAHFHTRAVTEMCWHLAPDERASAAAVRAYLTVHPCALQPALCPTWLEHEPDVEHATADSGFGEPGREWLSGDVRVSTL